MSGSTQLDHPRGKEWLTNWDPENADTWDSPLAWRTLGITTFALTLAFSTWFLASALAPILTNLGFVISKSQLYWLAAMPGLAGAVLRRSGRYAAMRRQISHEAAGAAADERARVTVTLKLFNLIARELGPRFLARGILIASDALRDFLERQGRWLWAEGDTAIVDDRGVAPAELVRVLPAQGQVWLRITPR